MDTFVIAEAGANHNKNFNQALKLIEIAKGKNKAVSNYKEMKEQLKRLSYGK